MNTIYFGDNLKVLPSLPAGSVDLIYIDPPFNTGRKQSRVRLRTDRSADGDRTGFGGQRYQTVRLGEQALSDAFADYEAFLAPGLSDAPRGLAAAGSLYFH